MCSRARVYRASHRRAIQQLLRKRFHLEIHLEKRTRSTAQASPASAVRMFAPYDRIREVNEPVRRALRELIDVAIVDGSPAFIFVNNRLEGNSPATLRVAFPGLW